MTAAIDWARPGALWALLLVVPIAAFSLYRLKRRRLVVAFLPLLQESAGGARAQAGWRRLTEIGSLVARVLALSAAAIALAGPRPAAAATPPEALVLVLDADVTTRARESETETRFERQVALAKAHVRAKADGPVAVVVASAAPLVALAPSEDREAAIAALDRLEPHEGSVDLAPAIRVAREVGSRFARARVLAISSRALPSGASSPVPVEAVGAGSASDDQGFVDQVVAPATDGVRTTVRWSIRNFASGRRKRRVEARFDRPDPARVVWSTEIEVGAKETAEVTFDLLPPREGAFLQGRLATQDAFDRNDEVRAWLTPPRRPSVLVVHGGAMRPFLRAVLDALGEEIDRERSGAVTATDFPQAEPRDVTVVDGVPLPRGATPRAAALYLAPLAGEGLPFSVGAPVEKPLVWRAEAGHPLLRGVDLSTAFVARALPLVGEGVRGLAFAESRPVVAEGGAPGSRWIAFGLDPEGSDLPLRAALPVLVKNAIAFLGPRGDEPLRAFYRAGEAIRPIRADVFPPVVTTGFEISWPPTERPEPEDRSPTELVAPYGGPFSATVWSSGNKPFLVASTATVDLDLARDVAPVRPAAALPPPAAPPSDPEPLWRRLLLAGAALLLLADLLFLRAARVRVATGAVPG